MSDMEIRIGVRRDNGLKFSDGSLEIDASTCNYEKVRIPHELAYLYLTPERREQALRILNALKAVDPSRAWETLEKSLEDPDFVESELKSAVESLPDGKAELFKMERSDSDAVLFNGKRAFRISSDALFVKTLPDYLYHPDPQYLYIRIPFVPLRDNVEKIFSLLERTKSIGMLSEDTVQKMISLCTSSKPEADKELEEFISFAGTVPTDSIRYSTLRAIENAFFQDQKHARFMVKKYSSSAKSRKKFKDELSAFFSKIKPVCKCSDGYLVEGKWPYTLYMVTHLGEVGQTRLEQKQILRMAKQDKLREAFVFDGSLEDNTLSYVRKAIGKVKPELALLI